MAVHDKHTGKGVANALLSAMIDLADNWLNLRRIELTVYCDNEILYSSLIQIISLNLRRVKILKDIE